MKIKPNDRHFKESEIELKTCLCLFFTYSTVHDIYN